jgi:hypothetical protein
LLAPAAEFGAGIFGGSRSGVAGAPRHLKIKEVLVECSPAAPASNPAAAESPWRFWLWPNFLSLDAPLVAVLWQVLLTRELGVHVKSGEPLVLALCVWLVYVADRVLDALRPLKGDWEPARKSFYRRHLRIAGIAGLCLLSTIIPLAYSILRRSTFDAGLTLAIPVLLYFASIHLSPVRWRARWPRELAVACLFTSGTFLAIWSSNDRNAYSLWAPAILFFLLCWANCSAIETWEWQRNVSSEDSAPSRSTRWAAHYLAIVGIVIACLAAVMGYLALAPIGFAGAALLSGIALALLAEWRSHLPMNALRVSVDLALCTPLLTLVFLPAK